jgi:hypothetical protein
MSTQTPSRIATPAPLPETPPRAPIRQQTLRKDRWWVTPLIYVTVLTAFVVYSTWAVFVGNHFALAGRPYISPFYSPCTADACGSFRTPAIGHLFGGLFFLSRIVFLIFPLGFRATCYYYRKAYYRSYYLSPPACAVAEPHVRYSGERRFPLTLQNTHRYWWYAAILVLFLLAYDAFMAFNWDGSFGMGLGTLIMVANVVLLSAYTFGCHSCRHIMGGRLNHFSKHPIRYRLWTQASKLNARHGFFAWASLLSVAFVDIYIRLVASGAFHDPRFF